MATQKFIITGGPGSGKTSLVEALDALGYRHSAEVSRRIIQQQMSRDGGVLPWRSLRAFAELVVSEMLREHDEAEAAGGVVFFDRGLPDVFGYLRDSGIAIPRAYYAAHSRCRYAHKVFILPPWPAIYVNDEERPQSLTEAVELHRAIAHEYLALGYELIEVPRLGCRERANFVLSHL